VIVFGCYVVQFGQCCRGPMSVLFNIRLIPSCSSGVSAAEFTCCNQRPASDAVCHTQLGMGRLKILAMLLCRPAREFRQQRNEHFPVAWNANCGDVDGHSGFRFPARYHCAGPFNELKPLLLLLGIFYRSGSPGSRLSRSRNDRPVPETSPTLVHSSASPLRSKSGRVVS